MMREDWVECVLGDLILEDGLFSDGDWVEKKDQDTSGEVRLIQLADIGDGVFRDKSNRRVKLEWAKNNNCSFLRKDDILLARMPDPLGRATIFPLEGNQRYITVVDVAIIRTGNKNIVQDYLLYLINNPSIRNEIHKLQSGTTRKRISRKNLNKILFQVAPLPIQRAIVAKIEALFTDLDRGIADLKKAQAQLKVYRQAVLKKAFEGELTKEWRAQQTDLPTAEELLEQIKVEREKHYEQQLEEWSKAVKAWEKGGKEGKKPRKPTKLVAYRFLSKEDTVNLPELPHMWAWTVYENICSKVRNGVSKKPNEDSYGEKIFRISAVRPAKFDLSDFRMITNNGEFDDFLLERGDIVFTRYNGTRKFVGVSAMFKSDERFLYPDKLILTRVFRSVFRPMFIEYASNCAATRRFIEFRIRTTAGQSGISGSDIKSMPIPVCSVVEQKEIVREIESRLSVCDKVEESITDSLEKAKALRQSILKKAFEGRLLSEEEIATCKQAPDYELAAVLLERIKGEKKRKG